MSDIFCPCGSANKFSICCQPIILGKEKASTAEKLMRARYSAYVTHAIDFLINSWHPSKRDKLDINEITEWGKEKTWVNLSILNTEMGKKNDLSGRVYFKAVFKENNGPLDIHLEESVFIKEKGNWYYLQGIFPNNLFASK